MTTAHKSGLAEDGSYKSVMGKVNITYTFNDLPALIRYFVSVQHCEVKGLTGDCWLWTGSHSKGYGRVTWKGFKTRQVHRIVYGLAVAPVPDGLEIDHLCLKPACINPAHLEPVTRLENIRRSHVTGKGNGTRTHCRHGHEFTEKNTYALRGKRYCRRCMNLKQKAWYRKKRAILAGGMV